MSTIQYLEEQAIYILREVAGQFQNPCLLFSGGKDSIALLHLSKKAFAPAKIPYPLLHIDTGHNFPETIQHRDYLIKKYDVTLHVGYVQDSIDRGTVIEEKGRDASRNFLQTTTLLETIDHYNIDACIGGARRDEEKARAKERVFSVRDIFGQWNEKLQRPEVFDFLNGLIHHGENVRVFPISNWTELDVWEYVRDQKLELPSIYYAHKRKVYQKNGQWMPASAWSQIPENRLKTKMVRFRTVGDLSCTAAVLSNAKDIITVIDEIKKSSFSERVARMDDQRSEGAMEERKKVGYF